MPEARGAWVGCARRCSEKHREPYPCSRHCAAPGRVAQAARTTISTAAPQLATDLTGAEGPVGRQGRAAVRVAGQRFNKQLGLGSDFSVITCICVHNFVSYLGRPASRLNLCFSDTFI